MRRRARFSRDRCACPEHFPTRQALSFERIRLRLKQLDRDRKIGCGPGGSGFDAGAVGCSEVRAEDLLKHAVDQCSLSRGSMLSPLARSSRSRVPRTRPKK